MAKNRDFFNQCIKPIKSQNEEHEKHKYKHEMRSKQQLKFDSRAAHITQL